MKFSRCTYFRGYLRNANYAKICTARKYLRSQYTPYFISVARRPSQFQFGTKVIVVVLCTLTLLAD